MCEFNVGDTVRLKRVTDEDKELGRYVGEIGIFQKLYNYGIPNEEDSAEIRFENCGEYIVYLKDLELVDLADVNSIFYAYGMEEETELIEAVKDYIDRIFINKI